MNVQKDIQKSSVKKMGNKGFTLVELLATIAVLSIIIAIVIFAATNIVGNAREKSYKVAINNIEQEAGSYVIENNSTILWLDNVGVDTEYQCVTVQQLIDKGYFSGDVLDSEVKKGRKVNKNDYIYLERDKNSKAVSKQILLYNESDTYYGLCNGISTIGDVSISYHPTGWSNYKEVTIKYQLFNSVNKYSDYKYYYMIGDETKEENEFNTDKSVLKFDLTERAKIYAAIKNGSEDIAYNSVDILYIDTIKPVINHNYTGSNVVNDKVTIPIKVIDEESGIDVASFTKEDIVVKIGNTIIEDEKVRFTKIDNNNYSIEIEDNTHDGAVTIIIDKNNVLDNASNGNVETILTPGITFTNKYTISYNANGGIGTMDNTICTYGNDCSISANTYTKTGYTFDGWTTKSDGSDDGYEWTNWSGKWNFKNDEKGIKDGKLELYARWIDVTPPTAPVITRIDYNTFSYLSTDASGISGYYVSNSSTKPTISSSWTVSSTKDISSTGTYYVWAKDETGNISDSATIKAYKVVRSQGDGTKLITKYDSVNNSSGTEFNSSLVVLQGTNIWLSSTVNKGYTNLTLKNGNTSISNPTSIVVNDNINISSGADRFAAPTVPTYEAFYADNSNNKYTSGVWTNKQVHTTLSTNYSGDLGVYIQYKDITGSTWVTFSFGESPLSKNDTTYSGIESWNLRTRNNSYVFRACEVGLDLKEGTSDDLCSSQTSSTYNIRYDLDKPILLEKNGTISSTKNASPGYNAYFANNNQSYTSGSLATSTVHTKISAKDDHSGNIVKIQYTANPNASTEQWKTLSLYASGGLQNSNGIYYGVEEWTFYAGRNDTFYFRACDSLGNCSDRSEAYNIKYVNSTWFGVDCSNKTYTGGSQVITSKTSGTGYTLENYEQTNAGTYTVTAKLKTGYIWNDGSTDDKTLSCKIDKATPTITLSKTSGTLTVKSNSTFNAIVKSGGGMVSGTLSATSSVIDNATVSPESTVISNADNTNGVSTTETITGLKEGTSIITVSFVPSDTKNYNSVDSKTYKLTVKERTYTVTADAQGSTLKPTTGWTMGSGSTTASKTVMYNYAYGVLPGVNDRKGYTFAGWSLLPSEYQQVEYIQSNGSEYIDTGYYWQHENIEIYFDGTVITNSSNQSLFGNEEYINSTNRYFAGIPHGKNGSYGIYLGTGSIGSVSAPLGTRFNMNIVTTANKNLKVYKDGGLVLNTTYSGSVMTRANAYSTSSAATTVGHIFLFANHNTTKGTTNASIQNVSAMRVYGFKLYDNDVLVRDMIPCYRKSDNVVGMYDIVGKKFYTTPTGTFTKSSDFVYLNESSIVSVAANHNIYAHWNVNKYTVTYKPSPCSGGTTSATATYGSAMPSIKMPTCTGYTFNGYYSSTGAKDLSASVQNNTNPIRVDSAGIGNGWLMTTADAGKHVQAIITLTDSTLTSAPIPQFNDINLNSSQYKVVSGNGTWTYYFDFDLTEGMVSARTYGYDKNYRFFDFEGTKSSTTATVNLFVGFGKKYYNESGQSVWPYDVAGNTTLYAIAPANQYIVTLNRGSCTGGSASVTATYGSAMPSITVPSATGYTFGGYYTAANGGGTQYYNASGASERNYDIASDTTLYAKCTANTYSLVSVSNNNLLLNGGLESYDLVGAPTGTGNGVTHTWDLSLNGVPGNTSKAYSPKNWSTGANMGVPVPEIGYHAHMRIINNNAVFRYKTNEDYAGKTGANVNGGTIITGTVYANRWLGVTQGITVSKLAPGKTYVLTVDMYRVSGSNKLTGGIYHRTNSNSSYNFYSGQCDLKPSKTGVWETLSWTFTLTSDFYTSGNATLYLYGNSGGTGEFYIDNIRLEEASVVTKSYGTAYTSSNLTSLTRTGYSFEGWYNNINYSTKLSTSSTFNNSTASFDNISVVGSNARIYAKWKDINPPTLTMNHYYKDNPSSTYTSGSYANSTVYTSFTAVDNESGELKVQYTANSSANENTSVGSDRNTQWVNLGMSISSGMKENSNGSYSGVEEWTYQEGRNDTFYFRVCDKNGNCSEKTSGFNIKYYRSATFNLGCSTKTLSYTGSSQIITNATSGIGYTVSNYSQTSAGTHTVTAKLTTGYIWSDGGTGDKTLKCSIAKVTPTITLNPTSATIEKSASTTFVATVKSGAGTISGNVVATSGSAGVATVSSSVALSNVTTSGKSATFTINGLSKGTSTITVKFTPSSTTNHNSVSEKYVITVKESVYTITYYLGNGTSTAGSSSITTTSCTYNTSCTLKTWDSLGKTFPESDNQWTFAGWATSTTGTSVSKTDGATFTYSTASDMSLYALGSRTFKFYSGIAPTAASSSSTQYWNPHSTGSSYRTSITVPEGTAISGWTFLGYRANDTASSSVTISSSNVGSYNPSATSLTDLNFRSKYERTLTIKYNGNGSTSGSVSNQTATQYYSSGYAPSGTNTGAKKTTATFTLESSGFSKTGYSLSKWTEDSTSGTERALGATYTFSPEVTSSATKTMYAKWVDNIKPTVPSLSAIYDIWSAPNTKSYEINPDGYKEDVGVNGTWETVEHPTKPGISDPSIDFSDLSRFSGINGAYVELSATLSSSITIQIFYGNNSIGYQEKYSDTEVLPSGKKRLLIPFTHADGMTVTKVRFDIGNVPGLSYKIETLGVRANNNQWNNNNKYFQAITEEYGSGIVRWEYAYDTNAWKLDANSSDTDYLSTRFSAERNQSVYIRACDNAGNCSDPANTKVMIDKTNPSVTGVAQNANTLKVTYSDTNMSGYYIGESDPSTTGVTYTSATTSGTISQTISGSGKYYYSAKDLAGNVTTKSINSYEISYNACSGNNAPSNQVKLHGSTLTLSSFKPTRDGYTFYGWSTTGCSATSKNYDPGATFKTNSSQTLYALWTSTYKPFTTNGTWYIWSRPAILWNSITNGIVRIFDTNAKDWNILSKTQSDNYRLNYSMGTWADDATVYIRFMGDYIYEEDVSIFDKKDGTKTVPIIRVWIAEDDIVKDGTWGCLRGVTTMTTSNCQGDLEYVKIGDTIYWSTWIPWSCSAKQNCPSDKLSIKEFLVDGKLPSKYPQYNE